MPRQPIAAMICATVALSCSCTTRPAAQTPPSAGQETPDIEVTRLDDAVRHLAASVASDTADVRPDLVRQQLKEVERMIENRSRAQTKAPADDNHRAEAMYWCGMCYRKLGDRQSAYRMFKRLSSDYPSGTWPSWARKAV